MSGEWSKKMPGACPSCARRAKAPPIQKKKIQQDRHLDRVATNQVLPMVVMNGYPRGWVRGQKKKMCLKSASNFRPLYSISFVLRGKFSGVGGWVGWPRLSRSPKHTPYGAVGTAGCRWNPTARVCPRCNLTLSSPPQHSLQPLLRLPVLASVIAFETPLGHLGSTDATQYEGK